MSKEGSLVWYQKVARFAERKVVEKRFPSEFVDPNNNIERVKQLVREGYGFLNVTNHFAADDLIRPFEVIFREVRELRGKPAAAAIGMHEAHPKALSLARIAGITLVPVANQSTIQLWGENRVRKGEGIKDFFQTARTTLTQGGVVHLPLGGGRRSSLGEPEGTAVMSVLIRMADVEKVAVMHMGLSLADTPTYDQKSFHTGEHYIIRMGSVDTREELYEKVPGDDMYEKNNNLDAFSYASMRELVDPRYLR